MSEPQRRGQDHVPGLLCVSIQRQSLPMTGEPNPSDWEHQRRLTRDSHTTNAPRASSAYRECKKQWVSNSSISGDACTTQRRLCLLTANYNHSFCLFCRLAEKEKSTTSRKTPSLEVNKIKGNNDSTLRENYANYISRPSAVHMRCQPTQWRLATNNLVFT